MEKGKSELHLNVCIIAVVTWAVSGSCREGHCGGRSTVSTGELTHAASVRGKKKVYKCSERVLGIHRARWLLNLSKFKFITGSIKKFCLHNKSTTIMNPF